MITTLINKLKGWRYDRRITSEFRKVYLDFLKDPKRAMDMHQQELLRGAFVASRGKSLNWAFELQKEVCPHKRKPIKSKIFPNMNESDAEEALDALKKDGYYIFPWKLGKEWLEKAIQKSSNLEIESRTDPKDVQIAKEINPKAPTYWHREKDLLGIKEFVDLAKDEGIKEILGRYLGCEPVLDLLSSWWSFPAGGPDSASAQLYHFDLDRVKWLKVFVYLNNVTEENGPHAYIKESHNTIGEKVRHQGRFSDEDVFKLYPRNNEVVFTGEAGTIFIENTLGFHKGNVVKKNHRQLFEFEYSINHFGYPYPNLELVHDR